jgi:hypothetical protein
VIETDLRILAATSGHGENGSRVEVRLLASASRSVQTVLEVYDGIRCGATKILFEGIDAVAATAGARIFNEAVAALTKDGFVGLETIPGEYGYEIAQAAVFVFRTGEQPHLDESFDLIGVPEFLPGEERS